jgi:hypothetical protein
MKTPLACGLAAAALSFVLAPEIYAKDEIDVEKEPISVMGCVQRETEYRRLNNSGKGGFLGFGGGLGNEYVLVNASRNADGAFGDCSTTGGGEAYELTGPAEEDLEAFVGQRVAINGIRKAAEVDSVTGRPTGGRQAGYDLRLFEVDVESFRALAAPVRTVTVTPVEPAPARIEEQPRSLSQTRTDAPVVQREPVETPRQQLPRTASPLAFASLIGLLALAGAAAARALNRPHNFLP